MVSTISTVSALRFESYCIDAAERWMYAGDISGQLATIDIDSFTIKSRIQAHTGCIHAVKGHATLPYVATLATDGTVAVWRIDAEGGVPQRVCSVKTRDLRPTNDPAEIPPVQSISQALGLHDTRRRIITRTGNGGLVEIEFADDGTTRIVSCVRIHGNADLFSVRYAANSDLVLSGSIDGELMLSREGEPIRRWQFGTSGLHWFEHVSGPEYLVASDMLYVARVDISGERPALVGPVFTRDDLEHVTYNRARGRAFVASFDRNLYEIDPETCAPIKVAVQLPFKSRWVRVLERAPNVGLIQCRDGTLLKADVDTGEHIAKIRETPPALWTAVQRPSGEVLLAGEGRRLVSVTTPGRDHAAHLPTFALSQVELEVPERGYTKRMALQAATGRVVLGRTTGDVTLIEDGVARALATLPAAVRDVAVSPRAPEAFVACEGGQVFKLDLDSGDVIGAYTSGGQPIWALAHNPEANLLAIGGRKQLLALLDDDDLSERWISDMSGRPKRMKWFDSETLMFNRTDEVYTLDRTSKEIRRLVEPVGNTVEDFIWSREHDYLVLVSYTCKLFLCDLKSGRVLHESADQMDYSKGLIWLDPRTNPTGYPLDFMTFGRSGTAHLFRIYDEKIHAMGPVPALAALAGVTAKTLS